MGKLVELEKSNGTKISINSETVKSVEFKKDLKIWDDDISIIKTTSGEIIEVKGDRKEVTKKINGE